MLQGESKIVIIENTLFSQDWIDESLNPFRYAKTLRFHLVCRVQGALGNTGTISDF